MMEVVTLIAGGQRPSDIATRVAAFLSPAQDSLDLARLRGAVVEAGGDGTGRVRSRSGNDRGLAGPAVVLAGAGPADLAPHRDGHRPGGAARPHRLARADVGADPGDPGGGGGGPE